jgi:hypothetical protein
VRDGTVSSTRLERALPTASGSCLLPLGYEDVRADTRCRTGPSAVRRRSREAARIGKAALPGFEPGTSWSRTKRYCQIELEGIEYGRRESNAQATPFEGVRSTWLPSLPRAP